VLSRLTNSDITSFDYLQAHQRQPWFCFLSQLAAMVDGEPSSAAEWRDALLDLSDGSGEAWALVVDELDQPAFMQAPVPEGSFEQGKFKSDIASPDDLDMLVTSKNHDVKRARITHPTPEYWLYALVTLQTMEGFLGSGNYGIVRMNGGFGSRPFFSIAPGTSWGERFRADVGKLREAAASIASKHEYDLDGHRLIWLEPWDGTTQIPFRDCHPYFIEICRRIRLQNDNGSIVCWRANTKASRIDAPKDLSGMLGDPWTPVDQRKKKAKALTMSGTGFRYTLVKDVLVGESFERPVALGADDDGDMYLVAQCLVRGRGKTEGLHERIVPIPRTGIAWLRSESRRDKLNRIANERIEAAGLARKKVLNPALRKLFEGASDARVDASAISEWSQGLEREVDQIFFRDLWESIELTEEQRQRQWHTTLRDLAWRQFQEARSSVPLASAHRYRAISESTDMFWALARKRLSAAFEEMEESNA